MLRKMCTLCLALQVNGVDVFKADGKRPPNTGLITAAAGGTGQFAVQLMKNAGIRNVVATCTSEEKESFLREIGATHVVNLKKEKLGKVLPKLFPTYVHYFDQKRLKHLIGGLTLRTNLWVARYLIM